MTARQTSLPFNLIVVNDELFLQHLDSIQATCLLLLRQHDLTEVTLPEHSEEVKIIETNFALTRGRTLHWSGRQAGGPFLLGRTGESCWRRLRGYHLLRRLSLETHVSSVQCGGLYGLRLAWYPYASCASYPPGPGRPGCMGSEGYPGVRPAVACRGGWAG